MKLCRYCEMNAKVLGPACEAASSGHFDCLKSIAETAPTLLSEKDRMGSASTAVHYAAMRSSDCLQLLAKYVSADLFRLRAGVKNDTPAHSAASFGQLACLKIIAEIAPETFKAKDNGGKTPLQLAKDKGHADCAEYLEQYV